MYSRVTHHQEKGSKSGSMRDTHISNPEENHLLREMNVKKKNVQKRRRKGKKYREMYECERKIIHM